MGYPPDCTSTSRRSHDPAPEETRDEQLPRPRTRPATTLAPAGANRSRHHRHGRHRPADVGMQRQPVIHRYRQLIECGRVSEFSVSARLLPLHALARRAELPRPPTILQRKVPWLEPATTRGQRFPDPGGHGSLPKPAPRRAGAGSSHGPGSAGLPEGSRLHALTRHHRLPRPGLLRRGRQLAHPLEHRYQLNAVHSGPADLRKTHPRGTPLQQQRVRWLRTVTGSKAGGGS